MTDEELLGPQGLFADAAKDLNSLPEDQKLSVRRLLGGTLTFNGAQFVFFGMPITGGPRARAIADELGVKNLTGLKKAMSDRHRNFYEEVIKRNLEDGQEWIQAYEKIHPSVPTIHNYAIEGPLQNETKLTGVTWSEPAYRAYWHTIIDKYARAYNSKPGWEWSNGSVGEVVEAVMVQAGLRGRPGNTMTIVEGKDTAHLEMEFGGRPLKFDQIVQTLSDFYKESRSEGYEAPVQATALARLIHLHEMMQLNIPDPKSGNVPAIAGGYDVDRVNNLAEEIKPLLRQDARLIDHDGLGYEFNATPAHEHAEPVAAMGGR